MTGHDNPTCPPDCPVCQLFRDHGRDYPQDDGYPDNEGPATTINIGGFNFPVDTPTNEGDTQ